MCASVKIFLALILTCRLSASENDSKDSTWKDLLSIARKPKTSNLKTTNLSSENYLFDYSSETLNDAGFEESPEFNPKAEWDKLLSAKLRDSVPEVTPEIWTYNITETDNRTLEALSLTLGENLEEEEPIRGSSLVFVFDSTGSMHDELNQVKVGATQILAALRDHPDIPIYNYVLVPFSDPGMVLRFFF